MKRVLAALSIALAGLSLTACPQANLHDGAAMPSHYGKSFESYANELNLSMEKMLSDMHAPGFTGDADIDFLAMMLPHHIAAVDMARLVLQHGNDPITRKLAEEIIASQQVEIASMQRRLHDLKRGASRTDPEGYPALGGTRGGRSKQPSSVLGMIRY